MSYKGPSGLRTQDSGTRITRGAVSAVSLQTLLELLVSRRSGGRMRGHRDGVQSVAGHGLARFRPEMKGARVWRR